MKGATIWITGVPAAGKTALALRVQQRLSASARPACVLDGDTIRAGLSSDLGLSANDRTEQARRVMHVAMLVAQSGFIAIVAVISPFRDDRLAARSLHHARGLAFVEVWVDTPLAVCQRRDPKGLYKAAREGRITGLTGFDTEYEHPLFPEVRVDGEVETVEAAADRVIQVLGAVPLAS